MTKRSRAEAPRIPGRRAADPVAGLAGSIAHDFSNLLIVIRNAAAFIRDDLPADHPLQEYARQLLDASERAATLTRQLQAIGRSQLLKPEFVRPGQVVRGMTDALRRLVPEDVDLRISVRTRAEVSVDVAQFQLAMIALVTYSAEQARSHGTVVVAVSEKTFDGEKLTTGQVVSGRFASITVAIPGESNPTAPRKRIFAPHLTGRKVPRGTDLRLATVHGIVTQSGGYVDASLEKERGTTFKIYLPVVADRPEQDETPKPRISLQKTSDTAEVVLVVEDDTQVRQTVREVLEVHGYIVVEARDGGEAQRLMGLFNVLPDLILTDLVMPNVTGRELVESLSLEGVLPKVLLMSGYTDDDLLRRGSAAGTYPFIRKPFTMSELAAKVREVLDA